MVTSEILTLISFGLVYIGVLIATITNIRIKIKELDVRILNLKSEIDENKLDAALKIQKLEDRNTREHESILCKVDNLSAKMDSMLEKINEVKVQIAKK